MTLPGPKIQEGHQLLRKEVAAKGKGREQRLNTGGRGDLSCKEGSTGGCACRTQGEGMGVEQSRRARDAYGGLATLPNAMKKARSGGQRKGETASLKGTKTWVERMERKGGKAGSLSLGIEFDSQDRQIQG